MGMGPKIRPLRTLKNPCNSTVFLFSTKAYVVDTHKNHLNETCLTDGHDTICTHITFSNVDPCKNQLHIDIFSRLAVESC